MIIQKNSKIARNLLLIGNISGPIKISNQDWFIFNTCPFDSTAHIIYNDGLENHNFLNFLEKSKNITFLFVADFLSSGLTKETCEKIYFNRFKI